LLLAESLEFQSMIVCLCLRIFHAAIQMAIEPNEQNLKALAKLLQEYHPQHYAKFLKNWKKQLSYLQE